MEIPNFVLREEENEKITFVLSSLLSTCGAEALFLINRNGQAIASSGQSPTRDEQALASLSAGSVAATHGLARILGEAEFSSISHQGNRWNIHISSVGDRAILVVVLEKSKGSVDEPALRRAKMILEDILKKNWQGRSDVSAGKA
ncbi:MAG TPA: roadblock/LC7 domain-containing protein [Acidobacteriota bacterium]|jgi:predicted regulator of Ras-like GTPase activity (Roadblock/LC7/MglB family)|nr:roadblock/LC7 domain-containing protein [Acidobacteriota bacterium]